MSAQFAHAQFAKKEGAIDKTKRESEGPFEGKIASWKKQENLKGNKGN